MCLQAAARQLDPLTPQQHPLAFTNEYMLSVSYGEWSMQGRETWRLPPELTDAFMHSRIHDLRIADLLPDELGSGFIAFDGCDLVLPGLPGTLEGAYWHHTSFAQLGLVFVGRTDSDDPLLMATEGYRVPFLCTTFEMPADDAIDQAIVDDIADLESARKAADSPEMVASIDSSIRRHMEARPALTQAMALVLNAMAFRKGYPSDMVLDWPTGAPRRMVEAVHKAAGPSAHRRATDKLWQLGWSPIRTLGPAIARELGHQVDGHGRKAHRREGHWRNQAHGPAMSLRKLIWIRPTFVGASGTESTTQESA